MCCKLEVIFRPILKSIATQNSRHPTAYFICQFTFSPHTHMPFPTPKLTLKSLRAGPIYLFIPSCTQYCGK